MTPRLQRVLTEVESISKKPMLAVHNRAAFAPCIYDPRLENQIQYRATITEECCIHELMHAKLWFSGFPYLELIPQGSTRILNHIAIMLNGIFHHQIIFATLETLGFDTKQSEENGTRNFIRLLNEAQPSKVREKHFLALASIVFARARLHTLIFDIEALFDASHLKLAKPHGEQLSEIVQRHAVEDINLFTEGLRQSLLLLQLSDQFRYRRANAA